MHQIKFFKGLENDLTGLEAEVNRWLATTKVRVVQLCGNLAPQATSTAGVHALSTSGIPPSDVLLIVLYDKVD